MLKPGMGAMGGGELVLAPGIMLTLKVLVTTIDAQWEGMGDV